VQAYCFKCRKKVEIKDPKKVTLKNGRPAIRGICPACGTKVFRIGQG
jgi:DNA-directed RNA polymerase subunit RPC12/RpoP